MDWARIERRFSSLQAQRDSGSLDEAAFRVEVAKLLAQDEQGVLWLIDADSGAWICNRGDGWVEETPPAAVELPPTPAQPRQEGQARMVRWLAGVFAAVLLVAVATVAVLRLGLVDAWFPGERGQEATITLGIASPADGSQAVLGQGLAIESTLTGSPDLESVDRVELRIDGQTLDSQPVQTRIEPGQDSLPLSQPWRPEATGEHRVSVVALSATGKELGAATITVRVTEGGDPAQPGSACTADAVFVRDVTVSAGTAFPPDTRLEKVWQVRNNGTCAWGAGYTLVLIEGKGLRGAASAAVPPTAAGESTELAVTFQTAEAPGRYSGLWRLRGPDGEYFGAALSLSIRVEVQITESPRPPAPGNLQALLTEGGRAVRLTWEDHSGNESGFRIYRADVEASIGLVAADVAEFIDRKVACGITYGYSVVAFTAAERSEPSEPATVSLPACGPTDVPLATAPLTLTPAIQPLVTPSLSPSLTPPAIPVDQPPTLTLTVSPTEILAGEAFTITFIAGDDQALDRVLVWGIKTRDPTLNAGRFFHCAANPCVGSWRVIRTLGISETWTVAAFAIDAGGQNSEPAEAMVSIRPPD